MPFQPSAVFHIGTSHMICSANEIWHTAWKMSKYGVISGPHFPAFSPNTGKYGPEITPYLETFYAATLDWNELILANTY